MSPSRPKRPPEPGIGDLPPGLAAAGGVVVVLLLLWTLPGPAAAYCRLSTGNPEPSSGGVCEEQGALLRWQSECISYSVVARRRAPLSLEEVRDTIDRSFGTWLSPTCRGLPVPYDIRQTEELSQCEEAEHNERSGNVNTIAFLTDWTEQGLPEEAFGLTLVWHDRTTGRIVGADMLLNDGGMGRFSNCGGNGCPRGDIDLQNVVTHEAGHFLGLGHSAWRNAAMYWQARPGEVKKRQLDEDDLSGLCSLYGGKQPDGECAARDYAPPGGFAPRCGGQTTNGCTCHLAGGTDDRSRGALALTGLALLALLVGRRRR